MAHRLLQNISSTTAAKLTKGQCALIAATLPNPIRFNSGETFGVYIKTSKADITINESVPKFPHRRKSRKERTKKNKNERSNEVSSLLLALSKACLNVLSPFIQNPSILAVNADVEKDTALHRSQWQT